VGQDIRLSLRNIEEQLYLDSVSQSVAQDSANELIDLILQMKHFDESDHTVEITHAISLLEHTLDLLVKDDRFYDYVKAFICYVAEQYDDYLKSIDTYIRKYVKEKGTISYENALLNYFVLFYIPNTIMSSAREKGFLRKFHRILKRRCPNTVFDRYVKYLSIDPSNPKLSEKYLLKALEKDDQWVAIYANPGSIS
jgi:hypothetical protein